MCDNDDDHVDDRLDDSIHASQHSCQFPVIGHSRSNLADDDDVQTGVVVVFPPRLKQRPSIHRTQCAVKEF